MSEILLKTVGLKKYFPVYSGILRRVKGWVKAVDGIDLEVLKGEILGIVGESGCGKSTLGRTILRLLEPTEGRILFNGIDITSLSQKELRPLRRRMQIIFQDPFSSLNPRMKVGAIIEEGMIIHKMGTKEERRRRVCELLDLVGLPQDSVSRYPHEFSGGQRQRICIARAMALQPELIIADEPTSSLDISVQAQILNLFIDLKNRFNLTYLFISHDLHLIRAISNRVAVMYLGRIVELGYTDEVFTKPLHPYTRILIDAVPTLDPERKRRVIILSGEIPSPVNPPKGCYFHPRCPSKMNICETSYPPFKLIDKRIVACHLY